MRPNVKLFKHEKPVWSEKQCRRAAKHYATDGLNTRYPFPGYIGNHYGAHVYNGGYTHNNKWYNGELVSLPVIPPSFEIVYIPTWGYRLIEKSNNASI